MGIGYSKLLLFYDNVRALKALILNPFLNLQFHLIQLVPVVFTCIVANKLGSINDNFEVKLFFNTCLILLLEYF